jgi:UDP-N-acetylmuramyl pentapeptide synthase
VLGDMLELGPGEREHHKEIGPDAAAAAALASELVGPGDVVLVKASRGVGLEVVAEALADPPEEAGG